ncbi:uncharacterized protein [Antedon mediterranea]|uniref:uncharacterized protein n=1 Tax=Antedon mediterranea TaxID=105859 RepID=UPI003AF420D4
MSGQQEHIISGNLISEYLSIIHTDELMEQQINELDKDKQITVFIFGDYEYLTRIYGLTVANCIEMMTFYGRKDEAIGCGSRLTSKGNCCNMKQYNGKFGCHVCFAEGATATNCLLHRYYLHSAMRDKS